MPLKDLARFLEDLTDDSHQDDDGPSCSPSNVRVAILQARDEERRRIARDLHDVTAQLLLQLEFDFTAMCAPGANEREFARKNAHEAIDLLQKQVRCVSYLLHPPELEKLGLEDALHALACGMSARTGIDIRFSSQGTGTRIPPETELTLFRIAQASLMNVFKHSKSSLAEVQLRIGKHWAVLRVRDFGEFASRARIRTGAMGVGVGAMQARMEAIGGRVTVRQRKTGTVVTAIASQSILLQPEPA